MLPAGACKQAQSCNKNFRLYNWITAQAGMAS